MKNIHIIPTDKPSKDYVLGKCIKDLSDVKVGKYTKTYYLMFNEEYFQPQNIYITNDEKFIKDEYVIDGIEVIKSTSKSVDAQGLVDRRNWRKIILTTDLQLIAGGVQAIDDEFLEWFIKNPSCEEVKVDWVDFSWSYFIIIPKEESKQDKIMERFIANAKQQETLEEASKRLVPNRNLKSPFGTPYEITPNRERNTFIKGAKWQQERSYSEEEVFTIIDKVFHMYASSYRQNAKEWFEQFINN